MENEGIMGLPAGQDMQNQAPPQQPVYVSSADSYGAALQGLGASSNDPAQAAAVQQAVRESIDELALSPREVAALLDVLEYMSQNPDEYPALRQRLIDSGMMDSDDLPEAYDAAYLGMAIMVLNEYQASRAEGAAAPMEMAPEVESLGPMPMAKGGLADVAQYLASLGQNGDTILAHITPAEARLLKEAGGAGTRHPVTGLPQFFLKKLFKGVKKAVKKLLKNPIVRIVATVALATVLGPAAASVVGAATGTAAGVALSTTAAAASTALASTAAAAGVSALAGEKINAKNLLISAATGYFGAGGTIGGVNPVSSLAKFAGKVPGVTAGGKLAQGIGAGLTGAAIGKAAGLSTEEALGLGLQSGIMTGLTYKPQASVPTAQAPIAGTTGTGPGEPGAMFEGLGGQASAPTTQAPITGAAGVGPSEPGAMFEALGGQAPVAGKPPASTVFGRMGDFVKTLAPGGEAPSFAKFKDAFLVNPYAETTLGKYAPGVATGLALTAATGGFKPEEVNQNPLFNRNYTGSDFIRDNPQLFGGSLGRVEGIPAPYSPLVPTVSSGLPPGTSPPVVLPTGVTLQPSGIVQPYNIAGLYGVPPLNYSAPAPVYVPQQPPVRMKEGGSPRHFPRKTGPINGPGTGTSDSIPAMLSDGEFVFTAKAVRNAGGGSRRKGAKRMYALMKKLEGGSVKG